MEKPIDQKKHFKMYKSGKIWVVAGIVAISLLGGGIQAAHADEVSTATHTTDVPTSASATSMVAKSSVTANNTYVDTQGSIDISKDNQATNAKNDVVNDANKQNETTANLNQTVGQSKASLNNDTQSTENSINNDSRENNTDHLKENTKAVPTVDRTANRDAGFAKLSNGKIVYYDSEGEIQYGLKIINGKFYYFNTENGEMCANKELEINNKWYNFTSDGSASTGFTKLASGKTVYYNAQGQMQYGLQTINGKIYYFNPWSGEMYAGREAEINDKWYNFTSDGSASTGFTKLASGKTVYYNAQGQMQYGLQMINGKIYYFNPWSGEMYAGREAEINDKWYNFTSDGSASTGFTKLASGKTVYYNAQGQMQYGLQMINGKIYYFNPWSGEMYAGREAEINDKWYNFTSDGSASTGFTKLASGKTVYYNAQGQMQYGLQTINGKIYYFNPWSGEMYAGREAEINDKWYNFTSDGSASTGFTKLASGKTVYYNAQGQMQYGLQTINGKIYYFNPWSGEMYAGREAEINDKWYNFTSDGSASTGFTKLASGKTVYYNAQGQMQYGLQTINGKIYYFNPWSGEMYAGREAEINDKWYNFTSDGSASTGFTKLASGKTVYYNAQGQMQYGLQTINGKIYYFNPWSGEMYTGREAKINDKWYNFMSDGSASTGFTKLASGKTVYYNAQGQMQHGEKKIDGKWFYFNENTGNVADGFTTLPDGRRVYYDINFQDISKSKGMLYGEQTLKNLKYYFNVQSGVQEKGVVYNIATGRLQYYGAIDGSLSIELQSPINTDEDGNIILNDGENEINDQWYYYDVQNGKMVTGWKKLVDNNHGGYREVYYDLDTAQMAHGEKKINGVWYYFDKQDGNEVVSSFVKLADGRVAYYDEKGHMSYGEKEIGNYWYYFDLSNGNETVSNFIKLNDGRTVYYNAQGHMVYNWQNINGSTYYFNPQNGNMYVGAQWINGQEYYFDYITGAQVKDQWTAKLLEWFFNRIGKLTYSMDGSRNGADGTADCSGSLTQALYEAGAWRYSLLYNTEMLHSYLLGNGYHLAYENNDYTSPVVGDVIIWGQRGHSAGGAGHTGVISGSGQNGTMISTCYWTEGEKGTAVQNFPYFWYWGKDNYPYYYVYRR
ncbi:peptidoglycan amidohydrolase family protein [Limosilactobacillus mucosae]|uniref:peptidoglycan amidohydrolase family protein n=1 Tax=Limosilactobacillus mucosae TaxID=97478 RepID=UPI003B439D71